MTETRPDEILNGADNTSDENSTAPTEPQEQTANDTMPDYLGKPNAPLEAPAPAIADTPPSPDAPDKTEGDGDKAIPSNVINGVFGDKQTSAKEAEKQPVEQDSPEKDAPAQKRGGRPPKAEKADKEPPADMSAPVFQAGGSHSADGAGSRLRADGKIHS